jgi:TonB family protein
MGLPRTQQQQFAVRVWVPVVSAQCGSSVTEPAVMMAVLTDASDVVKGKRTVVVRVQVAADGTPGSPSIETSSGSAVLDRASIVSAMASRYWPATKDCRPIPSAMRYELEFSAS